MREKNTPVGTSECPIKGCKETVSVYKYRSANGPPEKRRFAGRLYCICPVDGRVENQEFLLENIKWDEEKKDDATRQVSASQSSSEKAPTLPESLRPVASTPVKTTEKHASPPVATKDQPKKASGWLPEFFK